MSIKDIIPSLKEWESFIEEGKEYLKEYLKELFLEDEEVEK